MRCQRIGRAPVALAFLLAFAALAQWAGLWVNLSPSMPVGLYLSHAVRDRASLTRGAIVAACLPQSLADWGRTRGYLRRGRCRDGTAPVGKPIFAVPGDTVTVGSIGLMRNGALIPKTSPLARDRAGLPLPHVPHGAYPVPAGQLWLVSTHTPLSWDSRYFGPVPVAAVIALLPPIWVEGQ